MVKQSWSWGSPAQGHVLGGAQPWWLLLHQRDAGFMPRVCAHPWGRVTGALQPQSWGMAHPAAPGNVLQLLLGNAVLGSSCSAQGAQGWPR